MKDAVTTSTETQRKSNRYALGKSRHNKNVPLQIADYAVSDLLL